MVNSLPTLSVRPLGADFPDRNRTGGDIVQSVRYRTLRLSGEFLR